MRRGFLDVVREWYILGAAVALLLSGMLFASLTGPETAGVRLVAPRRRRRNRSSLPPQNVSSPTSNMPSLCGRSPRRRQLRRNRKPARPRQHPAHQKCRKLHRRPKAMPRRRLPRPRTTTLRLLHVRLLHTNQRPGDDRAQRRCTGRRRSECRPTSLRKMPSVPLASRARTRSARALPESRVTEPARFPVRLLPCPQRLQHRVGCRRARCLSARSAEIRARQSNAVPRPENGERTQGCDRLPGLNLRGSSGASSCPTAGRACAASDPAAPAERSVSYIPDVRYTLRSGIAEGRMVFLGVEERSTANQSSAFCRPRAGGADHLDQW